MRYLLLVIVLLSGCALTPEQRVSIKEGIANYQAHRTQVYERYQASQQQVSQQTTVTTCRNSGNYTVTCRTR